MTGAPARKRVSRVDLAAAVASAGLGSSVPAGGVASAPGANSLALVSTIRLTLDQVDPYEKNPRSKPNDNFLNIKASIEARGLDTLMWVTRRPGSKRYVLAKGGGTRYRALRQLWEETQDRKFFEIDFNYCEYRSEADLLAGHMSENLNRGEMCFWDKAKGYVDLKHEIEDNFGDLTYDAMVAKFKELGMPDIGKSSLALYQFAFDYLHTLGDATYGLTMLAVRDVLQPGYNLCLRLLNKSPKADYDFDGQIWQPTLRAFSGTSKDEADWHALMVSVEGALAEALGLDLGTLQGMLAGLKTFGRAATWEELLPSPPISPTSHNDTGAGSSDNEDDWLAGNQTPGGGGNVAPAGTDPGVRVNTTPRTFARAPADGDRPPPELVAQKEAEQRNRATESAGEVKKAPPSPATSGSGNTPEAVNPPVSATVSPLFSGSRRVGTEQQKRALHELAIQLASHSKTLDRLVVTNDALPMGWMIDIPQDVLAGTPLPPLAKQVFWFLARASFQIAIGLEQADRVAGSTFAKFLAAASPEQWELVKPDDGFDFLMSWLIDPEHVSLAMPAMRMLALTRDLLANHPDEFLDLCNVLDFQELQQSHQERRHLQEQEDLTYYIENGASPDMVRRIFPAADLPEIRFRPGRIAEIDLKTAQRLYDVWDDLCLQIVSERTRYIRLHQVFPDTTMASLYSAINDLG